MINFFKEEIEFDRDDFSQINDWIEKTIKEEGYSLGNINYIFSSDEYLLEINRKYLNHDYYTDIITFPNIEKSKIGADIYISIERVNENSKNYKIDFKHETLRVIIHGVLHLVGYNDNTKKERNRMRSKENELIDKYMKGNV